MTPEELDRLAGELHHEWESPGLWGRIERARRGSRRWWWAGVGVAAAVALGLFFAPGPRRAPVAANAPLLTEQALAEVEEAEAAYRKSIDKLARVAAPKLAGPGTPLLRAYAEKLAVLDGAIGTLQAEVARNGFNTHLHVQMAALYRDKQQTLEQVLHAQ
jgi:hypothetical protein